MYTPNEIEIKDGCNNCRFCCYCEETKTLKCYHPNWHLRPLVNGDRRDESWCSCYRLRKNPNEITLKETYDKYITHVTDDKRTMESYINLILEADTEDKAYRAAASIITHIEDLMNGQSFFPVNRKINIAENKN